ncbi:SGNH/GDSL hydrolase family protein [Verrucomicrobiaceae bacterium 227]
MKSKLLSLLLVFIACPLAWAASLIDSISGKKIVFLGDSITQAGTYVGFTSYYLQRLNPDQNFDIYSLGLSSETLSGLSEDGHAGGRFPRPCLFERLGRLLEKVEPQVVFACYGINCGIYRPFDEQRFAAFQSGVGRLIKDCKAAGVEQIFIVTPPIYDTTTKEGEFNYDSVMTTYAAWETTIKEEGVHVIDLHSAMRKARDARTEVFSKDRVHPGKEGHLFMATSILKGLGVEVPAEDLATVQKDPLFKSVDSLRSFRSKQWMNHIGYNREKLVKPQPLGETESEVARRQAEIDTLRKK